MLEQHYISKKCLIKILSAIASFIILAAIVVAASGVIPLKASSGNWPITTWVLSFISGRSIATHSSNIVVPSLDDPNLIQLGAATFDSNCAWCHGSPRFPRNVIADSMTPSPPQLIKTVGRWKQNELFYIVKHGIKLTGMPAWPSQMRDSEIWPLVAFLQVLPNMTAIEYATRLRKVTEGSLDHDSGSAIVEKCLTCHERTGKFPAGQQVPTIGGLGYDYLLESMQDYRNGSRPSGIMQPQLARLNKEQVAALAEYFSQLSSESTEYRQVTEPTTTSVEIARGKKLIEEGNAQSKIPACAVCHGPDSRSKSYPNIAGQPQAYIQDQLMLFSNKYRNGKKAGIMHKIASKLSPSEISEIASAYAATLP